MWAVTVGEVKYIHLFKIRELWKFRMSCFFSINALFPQCKKLLYVFIALETEVKCDSSWYEEFSVVGKTSGHICMLWQSLSHNFKHASSWVGVWTLCIQIWEQHKQTVFGHCVWTAWPGLPGWLYEELKDLWPSDPLSPGCRAGLMSPLALLETAL